MAVETEGPYRQPKLNRCHFQKANGVRVKDPATYPLRAVEVDVGLVGVRIAQDASAKPVVDKVATAEVTKGNRQPYPPAL